MDIEDGRVSSIPLIGPGFAKEQTLWRCVVLGERLLAAVLLVALSPLLLGLALLTLILSGRSPLIAHRRVGWNGTELWLLKFRTMWGCGAKAGFEGPLWTEYIEDGAGPAMKGPADARVSSRFARFCRRHSLDELPQLLHVAQGQMSLVGPRPVTSDELDAIYGADAREVLHVKPGLAGLWQVSGRNRLTLLERRRLDLQLVRNQSVRLYFEILLRTVPAVLNGADSW
jgi:lipopolysaccharide/colanic/teichoic acid biosynthesis glycosyltransferase